ncbi:MAG: sn-glycerol-1-phosphate dehydrogenase, partial [bacterium]
LNPEAISLVEDELIKLIELTPELKDRTTESIEVLTRGLINSGIAMQMEGNSRPASGTEHHISHFLEMYGEIYQKALPTHGVKVALGEYFAASLYLKLYQLDFSTLSNCDNYEKRKKRIQENYQARANPVLKVLEERWEEYQLDIDKLIASEDQIKKLIEVNMEYLKGIKDYLDQLGIFAREDIRSIDQEWILKAIQSAFEIRNRYTVAALLDQVGLLEEYSHQLLDDFNAILKRD